MATWSQKKSLMDKIKITRKKRPAPWVMADPRTNGFNPNALQQFKDRFSEMTAASQKPKPSEPRQMPDTQIGIEDYWLGLAQAIDSCPHELKQIMQNEIKPDNELVMSYFKKFISAIKVSEQVDFTDLNARKRRTREFNEEKAQKYKDALENYHHMTQMQNTNIKHTEAETKKVWAEICIALMEQVQRNPALDSLGKWDRALVEALAVRGPGFCKIKKKQAEVSFAMIKKMEPSIVLETLEIASQKYNEHQNQCYQDFLNTAPIADVERYLWDLLAFDPEDGEVVVIQSAIAERRGMLLVKDRFGGYRYVDPENYTDDLHRGDEIWGGRGFFDYEDDTVLRIWEDSRRRRKAQERVNRLGKL